MSNTKAKNKYLKSVAEALREARDMMNAGGRHWVKGAERALVDPTTHEPGGEAFRAIYETAPGFEPAYCSIGALHEISADGLAAITLAEVLNAYEMRERRRALEDDAEIEYQAELSYYGERLGYSKKQFVEQYVDERIVDEAEEIIVGFNDSRTTSWQDVRSAFTKAAKRLADRAR